MTMVAGVSMAQQQPKDWNVMQQRISTRYNEDINPEKIILPADKIPNYRDLLRDVVTALSDYGKGRDKNFLVIVREGEALFHKGDWERHLEEFIDAKSSGLSDPNEIFLHQMFSKKEPEVPVGTPSRLYNKSIDGVVFNGLYCEGRKPAKVTDSILKDSKLVEFSIDHCKNDEAVIAAKMASAQDKMAIYADEDSDDKFDAIPYGDPFLQNSNNVNNLKDVRNFLVMTDGRNYGSKAEWLLALTDSNYDMLVIDPFYKGKEALTKNDVHDLKFKKIGAGRLVIAKQSLTEASDDRYYWKDSWTLGSPEWLRMLSKTKDNTIITEYWNPAWKEIMGVYFKGIVDLGFDGVMFDGMDNHYALESLTPID